MAVKDPENALEYRIGVMAILYRDDEFLLIRKPDRPVDQYYFPTGGKDEGESYEETFYREIKEELDLEPVDLRNVVFTEIDHSFKWREEMIERTGFIGQKQRVVFAEVKEGERVSIEETDELVDYRFVGREDLVDTLPFDNLVDLIERLKEKESLPSIIKQV